MSKAWMPLYVADYLADTAHLSATESGAYLHLIMHYWQTGGLPTDDTSLARIAKVHPPHWGRVRKVLEPFFGLPKTGGLWIQKRVALELSKNAEISNKRKEAAQQMLSKRSANAQQMLTQSQSPKSLGKRGGESETPSLPLQTGNYCSLAKAASERARPEKVTASKVNGHLSPANGTAFNEFWAAYPRKTAKGDARRAFNRAITKTAVETILSALRRQELNRKDPKFVPYPATWLNGEQWDNEPPQAKRGSILV